MMPFCMGARLGEEAHGTVVIGGANVAVEIQAMVSDERGTSVFTKVIEEGHPKQGDYAWFHLEDVRLDEEEAS
jgi:hypothetical protein